MVARCAPRRDARVGVLGVQRAESSGWAARRGPPKVGLAGLRAAVTGVGTAPRRRTRLLPLALRVPRTALRLGCLVSYTPLASRTRYDESYESGPSPLSGQELLPKYFMPGRSRDLVERIDVFSRNVVERPVELLFEA